MVPQNVWVIAPSLTDSLHSPKSVNFTWPAVDTMTSVVSNKVVFNIHNLFSCEIPTCTVLTLSLFAG